jgi:membrane protease subunit HflK
MSNGPWGAGPSGGNRPNPQRPTQKPGGNRPDDLEERLNRLQNDLREKLNLGNNPSRGIGLALAAFGALWLASGFYKVDSKEVGVVQRFGAFSGITAPGLRYHLPYPFESVTKLGVLNVNTVEVGFRGGAGANFNSNDERLRRERQMLTGDQNVVEISFDVQWKIDETRPQDYLFNVRDPEGSIQPVAESAMREVMGKTPITSALSKQEEKLRIETQTRELIQRTLDSYKAGIRIEKVNLLKADPPATVIDAFRDVKTAEQDKETQQNRARAYYNEVIPQARGEAERMVKEAEGYKAAVVAEAEGNAARFRSIAEQYRNSPDATSKRLYIETMESVLRDMNKVIVDGKGSNALPVLPLGALQQAAPAAGRTAVVPAPRGETLMEGAR